MGNFQFSIFNFQNALTKRGFTIIELLVVLGIIALLVVIVSNSFVGFRKSHALRIDAATVVEVLRQARNQTLSSKDSSAYGVHFTSSRVTLFTGASYVAGAPTNQDFDLSSGDTIITISLTGGGSDVVFERLTGSTSQNGTIVISSPGISNTKTVTIYRTGLVESN